MTYKNTVDYGMTLVAFVPVIGIIGDAYFLGKSVYAGVTTGEWDAWTILLSAVGVAGLGVGMVRFARAADRAADLARAASRIDDLGDVPAVGRHLSRADSIAGGMKELRSLAKDYLKGAIHSPGSFRFLSKTGKHGLSTVAVVGEGKLAIVHFGKARWIGTFIDDVQDVGREVARLGGRGFKPAYYTDLVNLLLR